jgi:hypothetical protein
MPIAVITTAATRVNNLIRSLIKGSSTADLKDDLILFFFDPAKIMKIT